MERTLTDGPFLLVDCLSVIISKVTPSVAFVKSAINGCSTKLPLMVEEKSGVQPEGKKRHNAPSQQLLQFSSAGVSVGDGGYQVLYFFSLSRPRKQNITFLEGE